MRHDPLCGLTPSTRPLNHFGFFLKRASTRSPTWNVSRVSFTFRGGGGPLPQLQARLAAGRGDGSARGDRLCRAIALCDMFLRARADSEEALEVLKQEVQLALQEGPGGRGGARGARTGGTHPMSKLWRMCN